MNEISSSPGKLAKTLGISKRTLIRHLQSTGLIVHCYRDRRGFWRVPYHIAASLASPEALAVQQPITRTLEVSHRQRKAEMATNLPSAPPTTTDDVPVATMFQRAGITLRDMITFYQPRQQNHSAPKAE